MRFLNSLFSKVKLKQPEDLFNVTISEIFIKVEHPSRKTEEILLKDIEEIKLINSSEGPWMPDIWLALIGKESGCLIPHGAKGFNQVYDIVSKYQDFNFENFMKSMACTDDAEFELLKKI